MPEQVREDVLALVRQVMLEPPEPPDEDALIRDLALFLSTKYDVARIVARKGPGILEIHVWARRRPAFAESFRTKIRLARRLIEFANTTLTRVAIVFHPQERTILIPPSEEAVENRILKLIRVL